MTAKTLPRLLDRKAIAAELGVKLATAERIMRSCRKIQVGRRVYVAEDELRQVLKNLESVS